MIWLVILVLALTTALAVTGWRLRRERHRAKLRGPVALLGPLVAPETRPLPRPTMVRQRAVRSESSTPPRDPFEETHEPRYAPPPPLPVPESLANTPPKGAETVSGNGGAQRETTIRYQPPTDRTLQFLPGRFEVLAGMALGSEIRFVRTAGPDGASITFGRASGPPYRHVQLDAPTVSRKHATLRWDGAHWTITNLSSTNPVAVNGVALPGEGAAVDLADGDRIEMGEITFRFRAQ